MSRPLLVGAPVRGRAPERPPLLAYPAAVPAAERLAHAGVLAVTLEDLLAEPGNRRPDWLSAAYARVLAASHGPVLVQPRGVDVAQLLRARVERAGWLCVADPEAALRARAAAWPALEALRAACAAGSPAPALVLVGEREPKDRGWPFFARSGVWLLRALRELGWDELQVCLLNAHGPRGGALNEGLADLHDALGRYGPTWVALGEAATAALRRAEIPHVPAPHPAWGRRFHFGEGPQGFATRLREAGVPPGPYLPPGQGLAAVAIADGRPLPALPPPLDLPSSVAHRPSPRTAARGTHAVARAKLERARRAYVTGSDPDGTVVRTLEDAARLIGVPAARLFPAAAEAGWEVERDQHRERTREAAYARASEAEAKALANARRLACAGTERALASVVKRLQSGELVPSAKDAAILAQTALALSEHGSAGADEEVARLRSLPLAELATELQRTLAAQLGRDG